LNSPSERVETFATCTVEEVTPVWSLKALLGIGRDAVPLEVELDVEAAVVVVDDEVVELHAAPTTATVSTRPNAVDRLFHEAERKTPP
jgi:hypothetical protein